MSTMMTLAEPGNQARVKIRKYRGWFVVPVPGGYEVWSPNGTRKVRKKNVTQAHIWITRRLGPK